MEEWKEERVQSLASPDLLSISKRLVIPSMTTEKKSLRSEKKRMNNVLIIVLLSFFSLSPLPIQWFIHFLNGIWNVFFTHTLDRSLTSFGVYRGRNYLHYHWPFPQCQRKRKKEMNERTSERTTNSNNQWQIAFWLYYK